MKALRGLLKVGVLVGLGWFVYRLIREEPPALPEPMTARLPADVPTPAPTRRPGAGRAPGGASRPAAAPRAPAGAPPLERVADDGGTTWVAPVEGTCPVSHPVKAKLSSGIFHLPGGRHYDRTVADRCYRDATSAEADGLRPAKG